MKERLKRSRSWCFPILTYVWVIVLSAYIFRVGSKAFRLKGV